MLAPESIEGIYDYIGARIRSEREAAALSQEDLGGRVGLTRTSISNIELGHQKIQIHTLYDIASTLGVLPAALLPPLANQAEVEERYLKRLSLSEQEWVKSILAAPPGKESEGQDVVEKGGIKENPEELLRRFKINSPPVPVEGLARKCGVEIRYAPYDGEMSGLLLNDGTRIIIGLNALDTNVRQRFAVAHELGHLALHGDKEIHIDRTFSAVRWKGSEMETDPVESAANDFAIGLLVPPSIIKADLKGKKVDYSNGEMLSVLADRYKVGVEMMVYRLMRMGAITAG